MGGPAKDRRGRDMSAFVFDVLTETFEQLPKPRRRDPDAVAESLRRAVRGSVAEAWGKKPNCHVHVSVV